MNSNFRDRPARLVSRSRKRESLNPFARKKTPPPLPPSALASGLHPHTEKTAFPRREETAEEGQPPPFGVGRQSARVCVLRCVTPPLLAGWLAALAVGQSTADRAQSTNSTASRRRRRRRVPRGFLVPTCVYRKAAKLFFFSLFYLRQCGRPPMEDEPR